MSNFVIIGQVESCYSVKFGVPRQSGLVKNARAFLKIFPDFQPELSLTGLDGYSHLWVIFIFHQADQGRFKARVHPPRLAGKTMGTFATRTPHRPNPIGLSVVKIEKVENDGVWVSGVDFISGTPIVDIKPYLPKTEAIADASEGWTSEVQDELVKVDWTIDAERQMEKLTDDVVLVRKVVEETICLDPRPLVYRGYEAQESKYRSHHKVRIHDLDITFHFESKNGAVVDNVEVFNDNASNSVV